MKRGLVGKWLSPINHANLPKVFFDAPWVFGLEIATKEKRNGLRKFLAQHGIETRNYFFPLHVQPVNYLEWERKVENSTETWKLAMPNAMRFASRGVYVPTHSYLEKDDVEWICSVILAFFEGEDVDRSRMGAQCPRKKGWVDGLRSMEFKRGMAVG